MKLTPKESDVITLVAEGFADKEIGQRLKISPRTVQSHLSNIMLKLQARNRANAVAIFLISKYIYESANLNKAVSFFGDSKY